MINSQYQNFDYIYGREGRVSKRVRRERKEREKIVHMYKYYNQNKPDNHLI